MMKNDVGNSGINNLSGLSSVLESLKLSITNPQCVLLFNYYYDLNESSMMEVGHKEKYRKEYIESLLWKQKLIPMKKWQLGVISIGQRPHGKTHFFSVTKECFL